MNLGIKIALSTALKTGGSILPSFDPASLFSSSEQGVLLMPWVDDSLWQDTTGTVPALDGDTVGRVDDLSGNGNHAIQATSSMRPMREDDGDVVSLTVDGIDDQLSLTIPVPLTPEWTVITVLDRGGSVGTGALLRATADSGGNDYIEQYSQTSNRIAGTTRALSVPLDRNSFGLSAAESFVGGSLYVVTTIFRSTPDANELRLNGVGQSPGASDWPPELSLGSQVDVLLPMSNGAYAEGRIGAALLINRVLTPEEISQTEAFFAEHTGVIL